MKSNNEPWKDEPWYKLMYNYVPGQLNFCTEPTPERARKQYSPENGKTIAEEVAIIKEKIIIRDVEERVFDELIENAVLEGELGEVALRLVDLLTQEVLEDIILEVTLSRTEEITMQNLIEEVLLVVDVEEQERFIAEKAVDQKEDKEEPPVGKIVLKFRSILDAARVAAETHQFVHNHNDTNIQEEVPLVEIIQDTSHMMMGEGSGS